MFFFLWKKHLPVGFLGCFCCCRCRVSTVCFYSVALVAILCLVIFPSHISQCLLENKNMDLRLHNRHSVDCPLAADTRTATVPVSCIALHTGWCQSKLKHRRQAIGSTASARAGGSCRPYSLTLVLPATIMHCITQTNSTYKLQARLLCATTPAFFVSTGCYIDLQYVQAQPPSLQSQTQELQLNRRFTV